MLLDAEEDVDDVGDEDACCFTSYTFTRNYFSACDAEELLFNYKLQPERAMRDADGGGC